MQKEKLYKITAENGVPHHGGSGAWPLPEGNRPGAWRTIKGVLVPCHNGLHLARSGDLFEWFGPVIWEAEYDGEMIECADKIVVRKARLLRRVGGWNEQTARLFAADCAERVAKYANDSRCDAAILAARQYAFGLIDDAAWDAARAAAWAAAWAAASDAAWDAAWAAARAAARAATWAAARDAASDAARAAAWAAAWDAAMTAASDSAWAAAWAAARAAAKKWQEKRLFQYLTGEVDLEAIKAKLI